MSLRNYPGRYWDDVREGEELPSITTAITVRRCVMDAASTRDFFPGHHDRDYARWQGVRDMYLNTLAFHGFVDRLVTDWAGPEAWINRRKLRMMDSVCAGDTMTVSGKVIKKYIEGDSHRVDIAVTIATEHAQACSASVSITLPQGKAKKDHGYC